MSITTIYNGVEYRSRLEAKWAAFFDIIGWKFDYEPFDGDGYIPDFLIRGDRKLIVEIKPASNLDEYESPIAKMCLGLRRHTSADLFVGGLSPLPDLNTCWDEFSPAAGLLGQADGFEGEEPSWGFGTGIWARCTKCDQVGIFHDTALYRLNPCGHYSGDHYLGPISIPGLQGAWDTATNLVKWRGKAA